ncbi:MULTISPECIES: fumarylacetoacetate hydrolase family protein [Brevibacterium]|uniref:Fumarylacetoacetate hydrolase family protein n=1 Tax=Brevibacterium casei TaxID=33889 RepID=A0A7T3ZWQ7_9MICO|nr:fumarylacetoacetate hydrolase family protein [Brevibacterium casei]QQB13081.1 fumarylacetoacetate hydrolase family protein [Brevibacterium casei]
MKLANHNSRAVIVTGDNQGIDVAAASDGRFGPEIQDVYDQWDDFLAWAPEATGETVTIDPQQLGAVSPRPLQSMGVGLNYAEHVTESGFDTPEKLPPVFPKFQSSLTGPFTTVKLVADGRNDWEAELVIVIGREAHDIAEGTGWDYVAGVTVGQDLSERAIQLDGPAPQFGLGKSYPGYSPTGPWLVTPDELPNRDDLAISDKLDDEVVQDGRTSQMLFDVPSLVEKLSEILTLHPGDVIFSGTPSGVGFTREPPKLIQPGQVLETTIEGIGTIRQEFVG